MTAEELREWYDELYKYMAMSKKPTYMMAFGKVMNEMMYDTIQSHPTKAEEYIEKLSAIKWNQYLTKSEAEAIVDGMIPSAPWSYDVWKQAMESLDLPIEEEPCYNSYALWTEMNKQYSDHANTIAELILKTPLSEIPTEQVVNGIHAMALDVLKDKDGVYSIREYFKV